MASTPSRFKDLKPPSAGASLAELNGVFISKGSPPPAIFSTKNHAPLIQLQEFSPPYDKRHRHRASVLLGAGVKAPAGPTWKLVYYLDLPRMKLAEAYYAVERLRNTPGGLLARYLLTRGSSGYGWVSKQHEALMRYFGVDPRPRPRPAIQRRKDAVSRAGEEKIEHIAFHPTIMVLAISTTYARVHFFDLRTNMFLDYFLVAADDPSEVTITTLAFSTTNEIVVGLDTGFVDLWTVDLSEPRVEGRVPGQTQRGLAGLYRASMAAGTQLGGFGRPFGGGALDKSLQRKIGFFNTTASPRSLQILGKGKPKKKQHKALLERVELVPAAALRQDKLVGSITVVAYSPSGKHLAVGTSAGGVWLYNTVMGKPYQLYEGGLTAQSTKCTCLTWGVPPGVRYLPMRDAGGGGGPTRYQLETSLTALVAGMENGLVMYIMIRENGSSSITIDAMPVEFFPRMLAPGAPDGRGISQVLLVPTPPGMAETNQLYLPYPTLVVTITDSPGIHVFRLVPESILKASVPKAAPPPPQPEFTLTKRYFWEMSRLLYKQALSTAKTFLETYYSTYDVLKPVYVGTLDTSYVVFLPQAPTPGDGDPETETPRPSHSWEGYGGAVKHMAIDPSARRLVVSFTPTDQTANMEDSVVWFDASAIRSSTSALGALEVLRPQRVMDGDGSAGGGGVGEVRFAGGFEGGACAGMVTGGGKGVVIFPAWIKRGGGREGVPGWYRWDEEEEGF